MQRLLHKSYCNQRLNIIIINCFAISGGLLHALHILVWEVIILFVFFSSEHECDHSQTAITCFVRMSILYSEKSQTKL